MPLCLKNKHMYYDVSLILARRNLWCKISEVVQHLWHLLLYHRALHSTDSIIIHIVRIITFTNMT